MHKWFEASEDDPCNESRHRNRVYVVSVSSMLAMVDVGRHVIASRQMKIVAGDNKLDVVKCLFDLAAEIIEEVRINVSQFISPICSCVTRVFAVHFLQWRKEATYIIFCMSLLSNRHLLRSSTTYPNPPPMTGGFLHPLLSTTQDYDQSVCVLNLCPCVWQC